MGSKVSTKKKNKKHKIIYLVIFVIIVITALNYRNIKNAINDFRNNSSKILVKKSASKKSVWDAIIETKKLLGISDNNFKRDKTEDNAISATIYINSSEIDLNFANIILSGQIELCHGKILSGTENNSANKQTITILDENHSQKYIVVFRYINAKNDKNTTQLAIVIDDFGNFRGNLLEKFCDLDKNITFAILPDLNHSVFAMHRAVEKNHETIIHIPMEPISYPKNNPGKNAIYVHLEEKEIRQRMQHYIEQLPLCVGANNHMGSLATTDQMVMDNVLNILQNNGLYFVDSRTSAASIAYKTASKMGMLTFETNLFLDTPDISNETLKDKILQLESLAKNRDKILVITHCTAEKYEYLKKFIAEIQGLNFELVPVSKLLKNELPEIL